MNYDRGPEINLPSFSHLILHKNVNRKHWKDINCSIIYIHQQKNEIAPCLMPCTQTNSKPSIPPTNNVVANCREKSRPRGGTQFRCSIHVLSVMVQAWHPNVVIATCLLSLLGDGQREADSHGLLASQSSQNDIL